LDVSNTNLLAEPIDLEARHVTLIGPGAGVGGIGARIRAADTAGAQLPSLSLRDSIIFGFAEQLRCQDQSTMAPGDDDFPTLTTDYSNYPSTVVSIEPGCVPNFTEMNRTTADPMFANPTSDFHLAMGSPLIDAGDPAPATGTDIDGDARGLSGSPSCTSPDPGRRDIGADEFSPTALNCAPPVSGDASPPETSVNGKPKIKTRKKRAQVTWSFASTEPGTFECSLDGGPFAPCSSPFSAKLRRGAHTLSARATDGAGNTDPTPASFTTRVKRKR
jgi:hypothetical protein